MNNVTLIIFFALLSAFARGGITVIDRYQMGYRKSSVVTVNFFNNLLSMILVTILFAVLLSKYGMGLNITLWMIVRMMIYATLVQAVAYGYSAIFKSVNILESVLLSKLTDFLIPLAIFGTTLYFNWQTYIVSVLSTFMVVGLFLSSKSDNRERYKILLKNFWIIGPLLVVQAALSPFLVHGLESIYSLIIFTICTIYFRFLFTLCGFIRQIKATPCLEFNLTIKIGFLYGSRAVLTLIAQIAFTLATSSSLSGIAWVFLNMTSLFSVVLAGMILKERTQLKDISTLIGIIILSVIANLF